MKYDLSPAAIKDRAHRGARRLDETHSQWAQDVDQTKIDESHPRYSVAGQIASKDPEWDGRFNYRSFGFESIQEAAAEGFYFTVDEDGFSRSEWNTVEENRLLTIAWKGLIGARNKT
jgi:hypothetical protein